MTIDKMRELVKRHADLETKLDIEGVLATLIENPVYEFLPARLKLEGKENIRYFYQEHFDKFFPLIKSHVLINECWDAHSACMEYDLFLKEPYDSKQPYRIMVVIAEKTHCLSANDFM